MKSKFLIVLVVITLILAGATYVYLNGTEGITNMFKKNEGTIETEEQGGDAFKMIYRGVDVAPGREFSKDSISEEAAFAELASCAFEGTDKVYTYENVEITASELKGKETVYSVYFLNETVETPEGIKITDEKAKILEKYGENYNELGNQISFTKGDVVLSFIVENDIITSIEYVYDIK